MYTLPMAIIAIGRADRMTIRTETKTVKKAEHLNNYAGWYKVPT